MGCASSVSDILIVGGGFAGAVSALAIADQRRRITVLESSAEAPRFSGDLIQPLGRQLLAETGVLPLLLSRGAASIHGFAVFPGLPSCGGLGATPGAGFATLPYGEIGGERAQGLAMNSCALVRSLQAEASARAEIDLHRGINALDVLRRDGRVVGVRDGDGREWLAKLTLVAQGRHAPLRRKLGFDGKPRVLSISTALMLRGVPLPVPNYAHIFLDPGGQGGGPLLAHPIGGGETRISVDLPLFAGGGKPLAYRILNGHVRRLPSDLADALHLTLGRADAEGQLETRATCAFSTLRCAEAGVALVGDAAGCTHPITGTGMTTALVDARILREELDRADASPGDPIARLDLALVRYQQRRYRFARPRELLAEALYEVFCGAEGGTLALRRGLFRYWKASPRARSVSLALLSGEVSCLRTLFAEYLRVSAESVRGILGEWQGGLRDGGFPVPRCDLSELSDVLGKCFETFGRCTRGAMSLRPGRFDCRPSVALSP